MKSTRRDQRRRSRQVLHSRLARRQGHPPTVAMLEPLEQRLLLAATIEGIVTDVGTGLPLSGIQVQALVQTGPQDWAWSSVGYGFTDGSGLYTISGLNAGDYRIQVYDNTISGGVHYTEAHIADVAVATDATVTGQDLSLSQAGLIYGYVRDSLGQPVKEAQVLIQLEYTSDDIYGSWHTFMTDATGRYEAYVAQSATAIYPIRVVYADNPGATYHLWGSTSDIYGFTSAQLAGDLTALGFTDLGSSTATRTFSNVGGYTNFILRSDLECEVAVDAIYDGASYYSGSLLQSNISGSTVDVLGAPDGGYCLVGTQGWFSPDPSYIAFQYGTAPASVTITASAQGRPAQTVFFGQQASLNLYAATTAGVHGQDFTLTQGGVIHGRATDPNGDPSALSGWSFVDVWGKLSNGASFDSGQDWCSQNGDYYILSVPAGVKVYVGTNGWETADAGGIPDGGSYLAQGSRYFAAFTLYAGQVAQAPTFVVPWAAQVSGYVLDELGYPVSGAEVIFGGADVNGGDIDSDDVTTRTDASGYYSLYVPAGRLIMGIRAAGYGQYVSSLIQVGQDESIVFPDVTLSATGAFEVQGSITNFSSIAPKNGSGDVLPFNDSDYGNYGRGEGLWVTGADLSAPLGAGAISYFNVRRETGNVDVEDGYGDYFVPNPYAGTYSLNLPEGDQWVFVGQDFIAGNGSYYTILSVPVKITGTDGAVLTGEDLALPTGTAKLFGTITYTAAYTGQAMALAETMSVLLMRQGVGGEVDFPVAVCEPLPDGTFEMDNLPAGTYYLMVTGAGPAVYQSGLFTVLAGGTYYKYPTYGNHAPTFSATNMLTGAMENTDFTIPYSTLLAASNAADSDTPAQPLYFQVQSVDVGSLTVNGQPVAPYMLIGPGDVLVWTPPESATGQQDAFTVTVTDTELSTSTPVTVPIWVSSTSMEGYIYGYVKNSLGQPVKNAQVLVEAQFTTGGSDWYTDQTDSTGMYEIWLAPSTTAVYPVRVLYAYDPGATYHLWGTTSDLGSFSSAQLEGDLSALGFVDLGSATTAKTFTNAGGYTNFLLRGDLACQVAVDAIQAGGSYYSGSFWDNVSSDPYYAQGSPDGLYCLVGNTGWFSADPSYLGFQYGSAPASVTITTVNQGYPAQTVFYGQQASTNLYPASPLGTHGPDFTLQQGGVIHGRVVTSDGDPVAYETPLDDWDTTGKITGGKFVGGYGQTGANGDYYVLSVPSGLKVYLATDQDSFYVNGDWYAEGRGFFASATVYAGQVVQVSNLVIPRAVEITGTVTGAVGPIEGAEVTASGADTKGFDLDLDFGTTTDPLGQYDLILPAGRYRLGVRSDGQTAVTDLMFTSPGDSITGEDFSVSPTGWFTVDGSVTNFSSVAPQNSSGQVLPFQFDDVYWNSGRPFELAVYGADLSSAILSGLADFRLTHMKAYQVVEDGYGDYLSPKSGAGTFSVSLPEGTQWIFAELDSMAANGCGFSIIGMPRKVTGAASDALTDQDVSLAIGTAKIMGTISFTGAYAGQAMSLAETTNVLVMRQGVVDGGDFPVAVCNPMPDGTFEMDNLPAGTYYLAVTGAGPTVYKSASFTIAAGQTVVMNPSYTNHAPTFSTMNTLVGAQMNTDFTITYASLLAASNAADSDTPAQTLYFQLQSVDVGSLTVNGQPAAPGMLIGPGDVLVWSPPESATGLQNAFTVTLTDTEFSTSTPVTVPIWISTGSMDAYIYGYVKNSLGQPVKNSQVLVEAQFTDGGDDWYTAQTDAAGRYQIFLAPSTIAVYPVRVLYAYDPGATYHLWGTTSSLDSFSSADLTGDLAALGFHDLGAATTTKTFTNAGGYTNFLLRGDLACQVAVDAIQAGGSYYSGTFWDNVASDSLYAEGSPDGLYCLVGNTGWFSADPSYLGFQYGSAPASVTITTTNLGYPAQTVFYAQQIATNLYPASPLGTHGPDFTLTQGGVIHTRVTDSDGDPVVGESTIETWAKMTGGNFKGNAVQTGEHGDAYILSVPSGLKVWLTVDNETYYSSATSDYYAVGSGVYTSATVYAGQVVEAAPLVMPAAVHIGGYVTDSGGSAVDGAEVYAAGLDVNGLVIDETFRTYTDSYGYYQLEVPAGRFILIASADSMGKSKTGILTAAPDDTLPQDFTLPSAGTYEVQGSVTNFTTVAPQNGSGQVIPYDTDANYEEYGRAYGLAVRGGSAVFDFSTPAFWQLRTGNDTTVNDGYGDYYVSEAGGGIYDLALPAGDNYLYAWRQAIAAGNGASFALLGTPVKVTGAASDVLTGEDISLSMGTAKVLGTINFVGALVGQGIRASNSTFVFVMRKSVIDGHDFPVAVCKPLPDGTFEMDNLPAGTYYLAIGGEGIAGYKSADFTLLTGQTTMMFPSYGNHAPTLTMANTISGATMDTPFTITYDMLAAAANEADVDAFPQTFSFVVQSVTSGTLTKGGLPVSAGTLIGSGEEVLWTPPLGVGGTVNAFTVSYTDGELTSASPVQVKVLISKPDLAVTAAGSSLWQSAAPGTSVNWTVTVKNNGPGMQAGDWTVNWYLSPTPFYSAATATLVGSQTYSDDIASGSSVSKTWNANVPAVASAGAKYVIAQVVNSVSDGSSLNDTAASTRTWWFGQPGIDSGDVSIRNDSQAYATNLGYVGGTTALSGLTVDNSADVDYYRFTTLGAGTAGHSARIDFTNSQGDLYLKLYDSLGYQIGSTADTTNGFEQISLNGLSAGTYYAEVGSAHGDVNPGYKLTIVSSPGPDLAVTAVDASALWQSAATGEAVDWTATIRNSGPGIQMGNWTVYWYLSPTMTYSASTAVLVGSQTYGDVLPSGASLSKTYNAPVPAVAGGLKYVIARVVNSGSDGSAYNDTKSTLRTWWFGPVSADADEAGSRNDSFATAVSFGNVVGPFVRSSETIETPADKDYFQFTTLAAGTGANSVRIDFTHSQGDLYLKLYDSSYTLLATSDSSSTWIGYEQISLAGRPAGTYYVEVGSAHGDVSRNYDLTVRAPAAPASGTYNQTLTYQGDVGQTAVYRADLSSLGGGWLRNVTIQDSYSQAGSSGIFSGTDIDFVLLDFDGVLNGNEIPFVTSAFLTPGMVRWGLSSAYVPTALHPGPLFGLTASSQLDWAVATLDAQDAYYVGGTSFSVDTCGGFFSLGDGGRVVLGGNYLLSSPVYLLIGRTAPGGSSAQMTVSVTVS